jgi:hypothetical protein
MPVKSCSASTPFTAASQTVRLLLSSVASPWFVMVLLLSCRVVQLVRSGVAAWLLLARSENGNQSLTRQDGMGALTQHVA